MSPHPNINKKYKLAQALYFFDFHVFSMLSMGVSQTRTPENIYIYIHPRRSSLTVRVILGAQGPPENKELLSVKLLCHTHSKS